MKTTTPSSEGRGAQASHAAPRALRATPRCAPWAIALIVAAAGSAPAAGALDEATALMERVAGHYEGSSSYRIEFVQESYWSLADTTVVSEGQLLAEPPSLFVISYADGGRIVASGESLWVYVPQTNQFFCSAVDTLDVALDPAGILRAYRPDGDEPLLESRDGFRKVLLRPFGRIPEPSRLTVSIDEKLGTVTEVTAYSSSGDRTTYRMHDTAFDVVVPRDAFLPPRHAGAEVVHGQTPAAP